MMNYNRFRRLLLTPLMVTVIGMATLASCTVVDDTLGSNLVPENQQMKTGYMTIPDKAELNPKKYVETRLFQTDSIVSSNLSYGYIGSELNDTMGLRTAGFLSQYISYYKVDPGYFGYMPIFDSAQMLLSIKGYGIDTITPQTFNVYEVISNKYLTEKEKKDTTFYLSFDPIKAGVVGSDVLFTFTFPDSPSDGPATKSVALKAQAAGVEFIKRLMLQEGKYKEDYSIYSPDSLAQWVEEFKGFYIAPAAEQQVSGKGTIYALSLEASGLTVFGRNRVKDDPSLIKDTIGMSYYFYDSYAGKNGNVSINTLRRDYSKGTSSIKINDQDVVETNLDRPLNQRVFVDGMGGVVTELTFAQEFFDALDAKLADTDFKTLAFSQARMAVYFTNSDYDWEKIDFSSPGHRLIPEMNAAQSRLGLYTDFKKRTPIADYYYTYEKDYGTALAYGGKIERSRGRYIMDITAYVQQLWNSYNKERTAAKAEGRPIDLSKVEKRTIYLAPEAYGLYTTAFTVAQGMPTDDTAAHKNNAPIQFEFTYNMIK